MMKLQREVLPPREQLTREDVERLRVEHRIARDRRAAGSVATVIIGGLFFSAVLRLLVAFLE